MTPSEQKSLGEDLNRFCIDRYMHLEFRDIYSDVIKILPDSLDFKSFSCFKGVSKLDRQ